MESGNNSVTSVKSKTRSDRAGIQFPIEHVHSQLSMFLFKNGNPNQRVCTTALVFLAAVMEYLSAEVLELAGNAACNDKKTRIMSSHIELAIKNDHELNQLLGGVIHQVSGSDQDDITVSRVSTVEIF